MSRRKRWRCFHCDAVFTNQRDASEHFGGHQGELAGCQIKGHENALLRIIRDQQLELSVLRAEDGQFIRAMMSMQVDHAQAVRKAEEAGYDKGVRDMASKVGSA
jgi:hypothetical protein